MAASRKTSMVDDNPVNAYLFFWNKSNQHAPRGVPVCVGVLFALFIYRQGEGGGGEAGEGLFHRKKNLNDRV